MTENSVPIRFEDMEDLRLQLMFEERILDGFERIAFDYCRWLLQVTEEAFRSSLQ
jgi:hypothetical protein